MKNEVTLEGKLGRYFTSGKSDRGNPYYYGRIALEGEKFTDYVEIKAFGDVAQQMESLPSESKIEIKGFISTQEDKKISDLLGRKYRSTFVQVKQFTNKNDPELDKYKHAFDGLNI